MQYLEHIKHNELKVIFKDFKREEKIILLKYFFAFDNNYIVENYFLHQFSGKKLLECTQQMKQQISIYSSYIYL